MPEKLRFKDLQLTGENRSTFEQIKRVVEAGGSNSDIIEYLVHPKHREKVVDEFAAHLTDRAWEHRNDLKLYDGWWKVLKELKRISNATKYVHADNVKKFVEYPKDPTL